MTPIRPSLSCIAPQAFFAITALLCWLFGGSATAVADLPSGLAQEVGTLSQYKSNAEQQARILVGMAADRDISKTDYLAGQSLYAEAKAAFDGWIDQLIIEIQSPSADGPSHRYDAIQQNAQAKGDVFVRFVQKHFLGDRRGESGKALKSVFSSMREAGRSIWTGLVHANDPDRTQVIEQLQKYKWSAFEHIEQKP